MRAFRKQLSIYLFSYFHFGFEVGTWILIVSVPDYFLYFYFSYVPGKLSFAYLVQMLEQQKEMFVFLATVQL